VPVLHRAYDGGAGEVAQVIGAMTSLKKLAGRRRLLLVGDSKLVSYPNLRAMTGAGVGFIAPASKTYVPATTFAALDLGTATPWTMSPSATKASRSSGGRASGSSRTP
jgi:transposase